MKVTSQEEMDLLWKSTNNITDTQYDRAGNIVAFKFIKYYGTSKQGKKEISVSMKKGQNRGQKVYLSEAEFFGQLADNYQNLTDIKMADGKIIEYKLNKIKYMTDKPQGKTTFDILPYRKFLRVTWQRFWNNDTLLRNGYFGGLTGCNNDNIIGYDWEHRDRMELYDIDINHAYPYNYHYPLPCGRFYSEQEFYDLPERPQSYIRFYHIKLKSIKNSFNEFIPLPPLFEYRDLDFLIGRDAYDMIVSEYRLFLINQIYGSFAYDLIETFYIESKIYLGLWHWHRDTLKEIDRMKKRGKEVSDYKVATNAVTGLFGKRDETKNIVGLERRENKIVGEFFMPRYSQTEYKKANNYLPIAMCIADITAVRLFYILTNPLVRRISWNTDGAVIGVMPWVEVQNSKKIGEIKSKLIFEPQFFSTSLLYNKPLILDTKTEDIYNSKCITYFKGKFIAEETSRINTRNGFKIFINSYQLPVEHFHPLNLRQSEILMKLNNTDGMRAVGKNLVIAAEINEELNALCNPYDKRLNYIRHVYKNNGNYEQYKIFDKNFIKNT